MIPPVIQGMRISNENLWCNCFKKVSFKTVPGYSMPQNTSHSVQPCSD